MRPIRAIFFDFDGVLVDSEPLHYRCWAEVLGARGMSFTFEEYAAQFIGVSNRAMVEALCRQFGQDFNREFFRICYKEKKALYGDRAASHCRVPESLVSLLLTSRGRYHLGVVSSSSRCEVEPYLIGQGIRECFRVLVCEEDVENLKPEPEPYLRAVARLNAMTGPIVAAEECLAVEDSGPGCAAAEAAGLRVIRVRGPDQVAGRLLEAIA